MGTSVWKGFTLSVVTLILCGVVRGQDVPRGEIFGGYSYLNVDFQSGVASDFPIQRQSAHGWNASPSFNVNRWFAVEGDVAGYYKNIEFAGIPINIHDYSFAGGPRFNYRGRSTTGFFHTLVGGDNLHGSTDFGSSAGQNSLAVIVGGGIVQQFRPGSHWGVRVSGDYVMTRHNILTSEHLTQNNFRVSAGIVYTFGLLQEGQPRVIKNKTNQQQPCAYGNEAALLGIIGCDSSAGVLVESVQKGSLASLAGVRPGDIIVSIDGRAVQSTHDIEIAIAANTHGVVRVGYMLQGNYLTEREVKK